MKRIFVLFISLFYITTVFAEDPFEIIRNYEKNNGIVPFSGIEVSILFDDPNFEKTSIAKVYSNGNYLFRKDYLSPPFLLGRVVIDNGRYQYDFDPKINVVRISPSSFIIRTKDEIERQIKLIRKNYIVTIENEEVFLGRRVYVILFVSKYTKKLISKMWIDSEKYISLRTDKYNSNGKIVGRTMFIEINFNPKFSENLFNLDFIRNKNTKIEESKLVEEKINNAKVPFELPLGYMLIKFYSILEDNDKITHYYKYSDGVSDLSLFEGNIPFRPTGQLIIIDGTQVFFASNILWKSIVWKKDNKYYLLVGDIPDNYVETIFIKVMKELSIREIKKEPLEKAFIQK